MSSGSTTEIESAIFSGGEGDERADEKAIGTPVENKDQSVHHEFQEGGLKAWLVVFGCWCTSFASFGYVNSFGCVSTRSIWIKTMANQMFP
jgi:hypothetical protein